MIATVPHDIQVLVGICSLYWLGGLVLYRLMSKR